MFEVFYLHQTFTDCVSNQYTQCDMSMTNVTVCYGEFSDLIAFLVNFHVYYIITCFKRYIFIKLSQMVYLVIGHNYSIPFCHMCLLCNVRQK